MGDSQKSPFSLQARLVATIDSPPILDGLVTICQGRIVDVRSFHSRATIETGPITDLGEVALLPGLINAHTHLEFSDLDTPLGQPGDRFVSWLQAVIRSRRQEASLQEHAKQSAIARGLQESLSLGTTTLGEIVSGTFEETAYRASPMRGITFLEQIGMRPQRHSDLYAAAKHHLQQSPNLFKKQAEEHAAEQPGATPAKENRWQPGLSPHAPYTTSMGLVERLVAMAHQQGAPVAMHLAESPEELELMAHHTGPLVELLEEIEAWDPRSIPLGTRPLHYLQQLLAAPRSLVIHGNYLDAEEISFLGEHADRMAAIYCPRTHAYFGHAPYPLANLLEAGAIIALGTDSRASSPDLNLWEEVRCAAHHHPHINPADWWKMVTHNASIALGVEKSLGTIRPGKWADLVALPLPKGGRSLESLLEHATCQPKAVYLAGQLYPTNDAAT